MGRRSPLGRDDRIAVADLREDDRDCTVLPRLAAIGGEQAGGRTIPQEPGLAIRLEVALHVLLADHRNVGSDVAASRCAVTHRVSSCSLRLMGMVKAYSQRSKTGRLETPRCSRPPVIW